MPGKPIDGGLTIASERGVNARAIARMIDVVGPTHAIVDDHRQQPYLRELRELYKGAAAVVLRPGTTMEVAQVLAIAHEAAIGIVPQGGNTGLVGGQTPSSDGSQVVLSLARLNRIRAVDGQGGTMIVEAGATLARGPEPRPQKPGACFL